MVRLRNTSTRSGAGPILGALGAVGLTIAFVALRRSKPRQGDQDLNKRRPSQPTCAITWPAQTRPSKWSRVSAMHTEAAPRHPLRIVARSVSRRPRRRRGNPGRTRIHLAVNETTGGSGDRECPSRSGWRRARRSVVVPDARGARHRRAGQAMPVASRTGACRAAAPARSSELCRTGSGCRPSVGDHRAASPIGRTGHVQR